MPAPIALDDSTWLRLIAREDGPALASAYRRNRRHLAPWEPVRSTRFFESGGQTDAVSDVLFAYRAGGVLPLVLERGGEIVGRLTLSNVVHGAFDSADLGYWLDASLQGRGLMTRAVGETLRIARDELRLHRVQAGTLLHNRGSQTVLERNGFERIGIARRYLRIAGEWQDHVLFQALLEGEQRLDPPEAMDSAPGIRPVQGRLV
ncbi:MULTISPECIES: GNAT family N-acetyltransferase [unclassified Rathayibacter]|uniref:GNAT family N-acetyltransferase n=1 Tax=unclassified Rathayibacter TaxID=2609250 RepID=UPI0009E8E546|nr:MULTISPECIES: GNAT family N-acetyltransferase [unclassified Rathayibacter]